MKISLLKIFRFVQSHKNFYSLPALTCTANVRVWHVLKVDGNIVTQKIVPVFLRDYLLHVFVCPLEIVDGDPPPPGGHPADGNGRRQLPLRMTGLRDMELGHGFVAALNITPVLQTACQLHS